MPERKRILSVAYIKDLGESRKAILEAAGYEVQVAANVSEALRHLKESRFHLVIVGHAVPRREDQLIVKAGRARNTPTLLLYKSDGNFSKEEHFDVENGSAEFLRIVAQLCLEEQEES